MVEIWRHSRRWRKQSDNLLRLSREGRLHDYLIEWYKDTDLQEVGAREKGLAREYPTEIGREYGLIDAFNKECRLTKVTVSTTEDRDVTEATFKPSMTNKCFFQEDS
jgi:hypothetical protein